MGKRKDLGVIEELKQQVDNLKAKNELLEKKLELISKLSKNSYVLEQVPASGWFSYPAVYLIYTYNGDVVQKEFKYYNVEDIEVLLDTDEYFILKLNNSDTPEVSMMYKDSSKNAVVGIDELIDFLHKTPLVRIVGE